MLEYGTRLFDSKNTSLLETHVRHEKNEKKSIKLT